MLYEYECEDCKCRWEEIRDFAERHTAKCGKCGGKGIKLISNISLEEFKPMFYNDICEKPIWVESKKQLKQECNKHGVVAARLM